jgi:hypothetical protein
LTQKGTEIRTLDIGLHVSPNRLKNKLMDEIGDIQKTGLDIILGYGLCGRSTEGIFSQKSRLILPKVDDCVGALLGSRNRHKQIIKKNSGCYFLAPDWFDTELNIFEGLFKNSDNIPKEQRKKIIKMALKNYTHIGLLTNNQFEDNCILQKCEEYCDTYGLELMHLKTDYSLLSRLVNGPWNSEEFMVLEPGEKVSFF